MIQEARNWIGFTKKNANFMNLMYKILKRMVVYHSKTIKIQRGEPHKTLAERKVQVFPKVPSQLYILFIICFICSIRKTILSLHR